MHRDKKTKTHSDIDRQWDREVRMRGRERVKDEIPK
jgi:hypothetical protein